MFRREAIVDRVAGAANRGRQPAGIFERSLGRADQIAATMKVQYDIAARRIRRRDAKSLTSPSSSSTASIFSGSGKFVVRKRS